MSNFNVGDKVQFLPIGTKEILNYSFDVPNEIWRHGSTNLGEDYTNNFAKIDKIVDNKIICCWKDKDNKDMRLAFTEKNLQLVNSFNKLNFMSNVLDFFRNLSASNDEKLLKEMDLENPIGTPTTDGLALSAELSYRSNRGEIIKIATQMKEEADRDNK